MDTKANGSTESVGRALFVSTAVGAVIFPSMLGLAQVSVFKPLKLASHFLSSSLVGGVAVCGASLLATVATVQVYERLRAPRDGTSSARLSNTDYVLSAGASVVLFRALGGRFSSVLPSNVLHPGAFAREWILARIGQPATEYERRVIQELGRRHGCHSCGRRNVSTFYSDHQPPNKLNTEKMRKSAIVSRFYPQCVRCSDNQGWCVVKTSTKDVVAHPFSLRLYHLFVPVSLGLACCKEARGPPSSVAPERHTDPPQLTAAQPVAAACQVDPTASAQQSTSTQNLSTGFFDYFPLLILWRKLVEFLDSFPNSLDTFHITLWAFAVVASLGTI